VFAVDGSQMVRKTSQLQRNKLVQSFPSTLYRLWSQLQETLHGLAGGLWHFWACRKLLVDPG
jgi:hypothetical protein